LISKQWVAYEYLYLETLVAFGPYSGCLAADSRTQGKTEHFYRKALRLERYKDFMFKEFRLPVFSKGVSQVHRKEDHGDCVLLRTPRFPQYQSAQRGA
jgi:hypothetical protein